MVLLDVVLAAALMALVGSLAWIERDRWWPQPATANGHGNGNGNGNGTGNGNGNGSAPDRDYEWRLIRQAGFLPDRFQSLLLPTRVFLALILPLLAAEAFGLSGWLAVLAPLGFVVPDACLALVRRQRQRDVRQALSFFLDMMLSLLQAGLSLEEAFRRAAAQGLPAQHPLAEEVTRVSAELSVGRDRGSAFRALAERTGVQELIAVAEAVTLGLSRGVSLEATLKAQADLARARRREDGMRRLDKANAEILIPLLLCSFPMFVSLVIVPLGLQLMDGLELLARVLRP